MENETTINELLDDKPNLVKRVELDDLGLIKGIEYKYTPDGFVDWRAMIPSQYLYINPTDKEKMQKKYGKPYEELNIIEDKIQDSDLISTLQASKYLLKLRGYSSVDFQVIQATESYAAVNCKIEFNGNYETLFKPIKYSDNASANLNNTVKFAQNYLVEIATNRSFVRCLRNALGIAIISKEELGSDKPKDEVEEPRHLLPSARQIKNLSDVMDAKGVRWEHIETKLKEEFKWNNEYKSIKDLPKEIVFEFIDRIRKMPDRVG